MRITSGRAVAIGSLAVATLDMLDCVVVYGLLRGVTATQCFQGVASGLLGRASFQGGWPVLSAVLYGCLVFVVMNFVVVPLSAARVMRITLVNLVNGFLGHIISVGLPCLWAVHATRPQATAAA